MTPLSENGFRQSSPPSTPPPAAVSPPRSSHRRRFEEVGSPSQTRFPPLDLTAYFPPVAGPARSTPRTVCPPTPAKRAYVPAAPIPFMQNAAQVESMIHSRRPFTLTVKDQKIQVHRVEKYLGEGDYNEAYLVDTDRGQRVLKIPGQRVKNMSNSAVAEMLSTLLLVYKQFKLLLENEVYAGQRFPPEQS